MNRGRGGRRAGAVVVCAGVLLAAVAVCPTRAWADGAHVVVLQSTGASPGARGCLNLIREELVGGGFDVATVDPGPATDPFSVAEAMKAQRTAVATIALVGDPELGRAEIWILDRTGTNAEVRRVPAPTEGSDRMGEVLAIRTIEVLRASALKLLVEGSRPPRAAPVVATIPATAPPATGRHTVAFETGVSLLMSPGGLDPAAVPLGRLRVAAAGPVIARLTLAGLGTRPRVETSRGTAAIAQELALVELGAVFRRDRSLSPMIALGGGVLHVRSDGQGMGLYVGRQDERWAALVGVGGGVLGAIGRDLAIALEVHLMLAAPYPLVRFDDLEAATVARPALWTTLTLVSWL